MLKSAVAGILMRQTLLFYLVDVESPGYWLIQSVLRRYHFPHRDWTGTLKPETFGLSPFLFTQKFGRHLNGGGISENDSTESVDTYFRWLVSGKIEINCLSCHDADPGT